MFRKTRKNLVYLFILLIPFFIFFVRSENYPSFKLQVVQVTSIPIKILSFPFKEFKKVLYYHRTFDEWQRSSKDLQVLKGRLTMMEEVIRENTRLEQLLDFKRQLLYSSVAANVIGRDPSFWNSSMIIDKGSAEGIKPGMPVVNALGVVGKITEVSPSKSKVILVTDPQFSVAGLIQRPRESVLVTGTLQGLCRLKFINQNADIRIGDKIITSKLSSTFPEGLIVGEVVDAPLEADGSLSGQYLVRPGVSLSQLEEVLVIINK